MRESNICFIKMDYTSLSDIPDFSAELRSEQIAFMASHTAGLIVIEEAEKNGAPFVAINEYDSLLSPSASVVTAVDGSMYYPEDKKIGVFEYGVY